ncbi:lasso RiPP family leader peptide-containing protein [Streptomyces sp. NPDC058953]
MTARYESPVLVDLGAFSDRTRLVRHGYWSDFLQWWL